MTLPLRVDPSFAHTILKLSHTALNIIMIAFI